MNRMSGKRVASPVKVTPMMARVVSVPYSMVPGPIPGAYDRFLQHSAAVGWTVTTALRRLSSSITGRKAGVPSHVPP
jgi:hypothetical protein